MRCVKPLAEKRSVFTSLIKNYNLYHIINNKLRIKLEKNASGMCAMFSEAYGSEAMKKSVFRVA